MKRKMTAALALELLQNLDSDGCDAGDQSEVESDSDHSWLLEYSSSSSEIDSESIPRKKRWPLSSKTMDPDVPFMADALVSSWREISCTTCSLGYSLVLLVLLLYHYTMLLLQF